tara:strand:- start:634 stop:1617 length:984 start_codon:yes stop_codon:yes gene_type:complete
MDEIRARYDEIFETCARTPGGFEHEPDRRGFYEVSQEERYELWDQLYDEPGFAIWLRNFREIFTDEEANAEISAYIAERIRGRVEDPEVAEKLIPKDHGFGVQRVPMETGYLEAFNRENVQLVDISETPIERVTETGIRTSDGDYDFDIIVYATGFDAITGSFDHIDIRGRNGMTLKEKWFDSPTTFLGMMVSGFPNLLMPSGPQSGSASTNYPRGIENGVDWCTEMLEYLYDNELGYFEATEEAESRWTEHVVKMYSVMLMRKAQSWFTGYNSNVDGHEAGKVRYMVYNGGTPKYVATIADVADKDYEGIRFSNDAHMPVEVVTAD